MEELSRPRRSRRLAAAVVAVAGALALAAGVALYGPGAAAAALTTTLTALADPPPYDGGSNSNAGTPNDRPAPDAASKTFQNKVKLAKMLEAAGGLASCSCAAVMEQSVYLNLNRTSGFASFLLAHSDYFVDAVSHYARGEWGDKELVDLVCDAMRTQESDHALFPSLSPDLISFPHWSADRNPYKGFADDKEATRERRARRRVLHRRALLLRLARLRGQPQRDVRCATLPFARRRSRSELLASTKRYADKETLCGLFDSGKCALNADDGLHGWFGSADLTAVDKLNMNLLAVDVTSISPMIAPEENMCRGAFKVVDFYGSVTTSRVVNSERPFDKVDGGDAQAGGPSIAHRSRALIAARNSSAPDPWWPASACAKALA
ncbi:hypothetical protein JL722_2686 [Aureococcus anophagefferens]|nr:hypothetical protein JL722_2686 [Aureococcus anophagefferens]